MSIRKLWPELLGMRLYKTDEYFYAWDYAHARKKAGVKELFVINAYGEEIRCASNFMDGLKRKQIIEGRN